MLRKILIPIFFVGIGISLGAIFWRQYTPSENLTKIYSFFGVELATEADHFVVLPAKGVPELRVDSYVEKHRKEYPDCAEHEAIFEDAKRDTAWYLAEREYRDKERQFTAEFDLLMAEFDRLIEKYNRSPTELKTLNLVEKQQDLQEFKVNMAKIAAHSEEGKPLDVKNLLSLNQGTRTKEESLIDEICSLYPFILCFQHGCVQCLWF